MKKHLIYVIPLILIGGITLGILLLPKHEEDNIISKVPNLESNLNIDNYYENNGQKVYFVNNNVNYLKDKFKNNDIDKIVNELTQDMKFDSVLKDGGTKIYKNDKLIVIKCNTLDGNKDIYIGNNHLKYYNNFCK